MITEFKKCFTHVNAKLNTILEYKDCNKDPLFVPYAMAKFTQFFMSDAFSDEKFGHSNTCSRAFMW